jgi:hypothetical protein
MAKRRDARPGFDRGYDGHRRRQLVAGRHLTPAQRLAWLESTMEELTHFLGRARHARRVGSTK